jgi:hypothetical protein
VSLVEAQEPPCQRREILGSVPFAGGAHGSFDELGRAIADHRGDFFERKRASSFLREQLVEGNLDVRGAVNQRAVQIKNNRFDHSHSRELAPARGSARRPARRVKEPALAEIYQLLLLFPAAGDGTARKSGGGGEELSGFGA